MKLDALDHPKTFGFASILGIELPTAIGHLELLWAFTAKQSPRGDIGKWTDGAIARACFWTGSPETFLKALLKIGLIDHHGTHRLVVHDWPEHCPNWVRAKLGKLKLTFITTEERTEDTSETASSVRTEEGTEEASTRGRVPSHAMPCHALSSETRAKSPRGTIDLDDATEHAEWEKTFAIYPPFAGRSDPIGAEHAARRLIEDGSATWPQLRDAVTRYAALVTATNRLVMNPVRFFTDRDKPWSQPWPTPIAKADARLSTNISAAQEFMRRTETQ